MLHLTDVGFSLVFEFLALQFCLMGYLVDGALLLCRVLLQMQNVGTERVYAFLVLLHLSGKGIGGFYLLAVYLYVSNLLLQ